MYRQRIGCYFNSGKNVKMHSNSCFTQNIHKKKKTHLKSALLKIFLILLLFSQAQTTINVHQSSSISKNSATGDTGPTHGNNYPVKVNFNARYKFGNKHKGGIKIMH